MMKKNLLTSIFLVVLVFCGVAETKAQKGFIEIGDGTLATTDPLYVNWNYAWGSFLYTSAQLGEAKTIDKLAFFAYKDFGGYEMNWENQKIYLKATSNTNISMAYPDPDMNDYEKVYEGTVSYPANGAEWMVIDIDDFEYDGTSSLILHWQNNSGVSYATSGLFYGTKATGMQAVAGSDDSFPESTGGWTPWNECNPNMRVYYASEGPCAAEAVEPRNNAIKVDVGNDISFSLCSATSYDFYLGTHPDTLEKVASDVAITEDGTFSYSHSDHFEAKTKYYYKVVGKDGTFETESPIYKFETQDIIDDFPFVCDFEDYYVSPYVGDTLSYVINTNWPDSSDYSYDGGWKATQGLNTYKGFMSARVSAWHVGDYSFTTPRIYLPDNYQLSFVWRNNYDFGKGGERDSAVYNTTYLEISVDGGANWKEIDALAPTELMEEYVYVSYDLSSYSGVDVYVRWRYNELKESNPEYFWIDDIMIKEMLDEPVLEITSDQYTYTDLCVGGKAKLEVVIRNTGVADLIVNAGGSDGPFESDYSGTIIPGATDTAIVYFVPETIETFENVFAFNSNASMASEMTLTGTSYQAMPNIMEGFDLSDNLPYRWSQIRSSWDQYSSVSIVSGPLEVLSPLNAAKILKLNDSISPIFLVTPGVSNFDVNRLSFAAKKAYDNYDLILEVGTMSDPTDPSTFVLRESFELSDVFEQKSLLFASSTEGPYIAFRHSSETPYTSLRIDDVAWELFSNDEPNAAVAVSPVNQSSEVDVMNKLILQWTSGGGAPEGYKVSFGTDNPPTNIVNNIEVGLTDVLYEITEDLDYKKNYYWQVVPFNDFGECQNAPIWSFQSMKDPTITSLPYTEDFNTLVNTEGHIDYLKGWSFEDVHGDRVTWDALMSNNAFPDLVKGNAAMHVPFHITNPKDDYLYTPPFSLKKGKYYALSFWIHTVEDMIMGQIFNEEIEVNIGTDNKASAMSVDPLVYANVNTEEWKKVEVEFSVDEDESYFIGFHAISQPAYVLVLDDVKLTEVGGPNNAPTFESTAIDTAVVDIAYSYMITASDLDDDQILFSTPTLPEWLFLSGLGNGKAELSGTPTEAGVYPVVVEITDGDITTEQAFDITVSESLSVMDQQETLVLVYPNPNKGTFNFQVPNGEITDDVIIVDLAGRVVFTSISTQSSQQISISNLDAGVYYLVTEINNKPVTQKLVVE